MIPAPTSPDRSRDALRCLQDFVACDRTGCVRLPRFAVLAGRYDRGSPAGSDGVVAPPRVEGAVGGAAGDLLLRRDLVEQFGQHGRIADLAGGELGGRDLHGFLTDPDADLAPDAPFRATMFAGAPLAFTLDFDTGAVHQQEQRTVRSAIGDVDLQRNLAAAERAEVPHRPVRADQP